MDVSNAGLGDRIAAIGAVVLLIAMLLLGWYKINEITVADPTGSGQDITITADDLEASGQDADDSASAFQAFSFIDILLLLAAIAAIVGVVLRVTGNPAGANAGTIVLGAGAVAFLLILFRLIVVPDFSGNLGDAGVPDNIDVEVDSGRGIGLFVGLIASAAIAYGGMLMSGQRPGSAGSQV